MVTDNTGAKVGERLYYPWGQRWAWPGAWTTLEFAAFRETIAGSADLYATPFRHYAPAQYRWLSPDPVGGDITNPQSLNRYAYVHNNPVNLTDPLGLCVPYCYPGLGMPPEGWRAQDAPTSTFGAMASFYGHGGSSAYTINGMEASGQVVSGLLAMDAAVICPDGPCNGMVSGPDGIWLPVEYTATSAGASYTCSLPGQYGNINTAGTAAVWCANGLSIAMNREFAGEIYQMTGGTFSFTRPRQGSLAGSNIDPTRIPSGTSFAGDYHTHGVYDPRFDNERFSPTDIRGIDLSGNPGYLGTPGSRIQVYTPNVFGAFPRGCVIIGPAVPANGGPAVPRCQ